MHTPINSFPLLSPTSYGISKMERRRPAACWSPDGYTVSCCAHIYLTVLMFLKISFAYILLYDGANRRRTIFWSGSVRGRSMEWVVPLCITAQYCSELGVWNNVSVILRFLQYTNNLQSCNYNLRHSVSALMVVIVVIVVMVASWALDDGAKCMQ